MAKQWAISISGLFYNSLGTTIIIIIIILIIIIIIKIIIIIIIIIIGLTTASVKDTAVNSTDSAVHHYHFIHVIS